MAKRKKKKGVKRSTQKQYTWTTRSPIKTPNAKLLYKLNPQSFRKPNFRAIAPYKRPSLSRYFQYPNVRRRLRHDRRLWRPTSSPDERFGPRDQRLTFVLRNKTTTGKKYHGSHLGFKGAILVEICKRRRSRRVALFALGKAGKRIKNTKPKNLNQYSKIRC